ncbi:helix-turn-helix domain-containing protein [Novosphingobium lentum]|uniref:helix-turn-helix domain-containing protein n=1 Tax=Novosphingobium lentum TaxID=145287 RepID=UPI000831DA24|nr:helix-turn-helix domain-containing protein [Novosphingobium lentum]
MNHIRPALDRSIASGSGATRDGQPMSFSRAPAADLAPWIARLYVTVVEAPQDYSFECGLLNDTAFVRMQLGGRWRADTVRGRYHFGREALFFGPHSRRMPLRVTGPFTSLGYSLRPGACHALGGPVVADHVDCITRLDDIGQSGQRMLGLIDPDACHEEWLVALEDEFRTQLAKSGAREPDPISARFEATAFTDPSVTISGFARECGIELRRLERLIRRDFGMPPKQVLRRARALDMASHLRGVADHEEAEALALRYYDQSHLIREFSELFGLSPSQFVDTPQPLMTLALETRQARRLEMTERLAPGAIRPWQ